MRKAIIKTIDIYYDIIPGDKCDIIYEGKKSSNYNISNKNWEQVLKMVEFQSNLIDIINLITENCKKFVIDMKR